MTDAPFQITPRSKVAAHAMSVLDVLGYHLAVEHCPHAQGTPERVEWMATLGYAVQAEEGVA